MRIVVVSPESQVHRSNLQYDLSAYFKNELRVRTDIPVQLYWGINLVSPPIGSGREALVVLDRRLLRLNEDIDAPANRVSSSNPSELRYALIKNAFQMTRKVCDEQGIPHILYEGEIERGVPDGLIKKLDDVKEKILLRVVGDTFE